MSELELLETVDDFSPGEFGLLGFHNAPKGSWTGKNMMTYRDKAIGPRDGLLDITPSGQSNGQVSVIGFTGIPDHEVWYLQGANVYRFPIGDAGDEARESAYTGATITAPTQPPSYYTDLLSEGFLVVEGDKAYKLDHEAKTKTALTGSPSGRCVIRYGDRLLIGASGNDNRIRYSEAANYNSWPALNFIDVGNDVFIRGFFIMRDFLVIVLSSLETWILTGVPGVNETLRRVTRFEEGGGVFTSMRGATVGDDALWTVSNQGDPGPTVERFNGVRWERLEEQYGWSDKNGQTPNTIPTEYTVVRLAETDEFIALGNDVGLLRRRGACHRFEFEQTIVGLAIDGADGGVVLTDGGGASATPSFYWLNTDMERPPIEGAGVKLRDSTTDGDTRPSCEFTMSDWYPKEAEEVLVRHVVVDFYTYTDGGDDDNQLKVTVSAVGAYLATAPVDSATQTWSAEQAGGEDGQLRSQVFSFGDQGRGAGYRIKFSDLRGVKIVKYRVYGVREPARLS